MKEALKASRHYSFVMDSTFMRETSICKLLLLRKRKMTKSLEPLMNREGTALNLHNNLIIVYYALPDNLLNLALPSLQHILY